MQQPGLEVICGVMFSGKTEELIRRLRRVQIASAVTGLKWAVFKPEIDTRYDDAAIVSHSRASIDAIPIKTAQEALSCHLDLAHVVAFDEAQFFDRGILDVVERLSVEKRVIVAGLDLDYRGLPFGPMPELLAMADSVTKLTAVCKKCGGTATRTQRLTAGLEQILVGAEQYEARCRACFQPPTRGETFSLPEGIIEPRVEVVVENEADKADSTKFRFRVTNVRLP